MALTVLATVSGVLWPDQAQAGDVAYAVPQESVELAADRTVGAEQTQGNDTGQLHRLFLDGHLAQQLVRTLHGFA
jgi:hypothetical protein